MPNDVYEVARQELATALSPRAADRVLADALAAVGVSAEAVTARQMRALLTGPIQRDLRGTLPSPGLSTILRRATTELRHMSEPTPAIPPVGPVGAESAPIGVEPAPAEAATAGDSAAEPSPATRPPTPRPPSPGIDVRASDDIGRASRATNASSAPGSAVVDRKRAPPTMRSHPPVPAPFLHAELDLEQLAGLARTFARLEHVTGVAVISEGEARFVRGHGLDAERAARLVPIAAQVMARRGPWRSYSLVHDRGQIFILPIGKDHLVLVGRMEFNLGAVLTALETLEEAL